MLRCAFLGDEVTAAGFRLAGLETRVAGPGDPLPLFEALLGRVDLLLITADLAARLPRQALERAWARGRPLLLVIGDARAQRAPPDLAALLRRRLGMLQ